jgi:hypothetical protein
MFASDGRANTVGTFFTSRQTVRSPDGKCGTVDISIPREVMEFVLEQIAPPVRVRPN